MPTSRATEPRILLSAPFATALDAWNAPGVYYLGRVVDAGDLAALAMLPAAWMYTGRRTRAHSATARRARP